MDNPGNIIFPINLMGKNYANWSRLTASGLKSKNKLGFMNGSLSIGKNTSLDDHAWEKCNAMVIAWLYNVIDKTLYGSIAYAQTIEELWKDLRERYSPSNEIRIH